MQSQATTLNQLCAPCGMSGKAMRIKPYRPNFFSTPAWSMAVAVGAALYPSGAQVWNGQSETRIPKPKSSYGNMERCPLAAIGLVLK